MTTNGKLQAVGTPAESDEAAPGGVGGWVLRSGVERALRLQHPLVTAHVAAVRRKHPEMGPAEVIDRLGRQYQVAVAVTGGAGGAIAILPALGTIASLATAGAEAFAALDAAVLYTLAVAEVHSLPTDEPERRRALVLGVVVGAGGQAVLRKVTGRSRDWAQEVTDHLPLARLGALNNGLTRWFVKRYIVRQGMLALGRALPLGVGVVIGAVGNIATARAVVRSAEAAFGAPPATWSEAGAPTR
ncbi:hypothetical protein [Pseudonocardia sp. TRM90224]|uniref:hypothetical protein n=1 Tax=Pseudonocardia sp. TRM90224 TaxID=2812678 RepID=UPI001E3AA115|nr:hypothetical protein [Pseudonocardia sp. TRM90224]